LLGLFLPQFLDDTLETVGGRQTDLNLVFTALNPILCFLADLIPILVMFAFTDLDQPLPDFGINELLVIKNLFEVGFGVVIQLNYLIVTTMMKS
jgi:hypothetical protein